MKISQLHHVIFWQGLFGGSLVSWALLVLWRKPFKAFLSFLEFAKYMHACMQAWIHAKPFGRRRRSEETKHKGFSQQSFPLTMTTAEAQALSSSKNSSAFKDQFDKICKCKHGSKIPSELGRFPSTLSF